MEVDSVTSDKPLSVLRRWASTEHFVTNALWFQLFWFVAVVGQDRYLLLAVALLAIHFLSVDSIKDELKAILPLAFLGISMDVMLTVSGVFNFQSPFVFPLWLCFLWVAFIATLSRSLSFLRKSIFFPIVLGAVSGSFSYWMGSNFGAVKFGIGEIQAVLLIASLWAVLLPCLVHLDKKLREALVSHE